MSQNPNIGSLAGTWTYRSFINDPDGSTPFNNLEFGDQVYEAPMGVFTGRIYVAPPWPNGIDQRPAIAGTIVRTIPHPGNGGIAPAGEVCSWIAVRQDDPPK